MKKYLLLISSVIIIKIVFAQPDLVCSSIICNQKSIAIGSNINLSFKVKNIGNAIANKTHTNVLLYDSATETTTEVMLVSTEIINPGDSTGYYNSIFNIPYNTNIGSKYLSVTVNARNEINELHTNNNNTTLSNKIYVTSNVVGQQNLPYPVILVHGLNSLDTTWNSFKNDVKNNYGYSFGGNMDFCLNQDSDITKSNLNTDVKDWSDTTHIKNGDFYTVNFDIDNLGNKYPKVDIESNQSAAIKQGWAIQQAVRHVLKVTGKNKVILFGHSMGGLASREYLQDSLKWQPDGKHHIAKLGTFGTPHGGSNSSSNGIGILFLGLFTPNEQSEAVRDLRLTYDFSNDSGVYLYGGLESYNVMKTPSFDGPYYNINVNCNGYIGDQIIGLNHKTIPIDLPYTCIIGYDVSSSLCDSCDGVVNEISANLNNYLPQVKADTFICVSSGTILPFHVYETQQTPYIMKGLDEPDIMNLAYGINLGTYYFGNFTQKNAASKILTDSDYYKISTPTNGILNINLNNLEPGQVGIKIIDSATNVIKYLNYSSGKGSLTLKDSNLQKSTYYINIFAIADSNSWLYPYSFKTSFIATDTFTYQGCNSLSFGGKTYNNTDSLKDTIRTSLGIDSVYRLLIFNITKITPKFDTVNVSGCNPVTYNGIRYSTTKSFTDTIKTNIGCDSIYRKLNITVNQNCISYTNVTFKVDVTNYLKEGNAIDTGGIRIAGNFNTIGSKLQDWKPTDSNCAMKKIGSTNVWSITVAIPDTSYNKTLLYKFVNTNWGNNEGIDFSSGLYNSGCGLYDGSSSYNRYLYIPFNDSTVSFCWDQCLLCDTTHTIPTITTGTISSISQTKFSLINNNLTQTGGVNLLYYGTIVSTNSNPDFYNLNSIKYNLFAYPFWGLYNDTILNLQPGTTYYTRAFASNTINTGYGNIIKFTTCPVVIKDTINLSGCVSVLYKGKTYSVSTSFLDTTKTINGCDSLYNTVEISINNTSFPYNVLQDTIRACDDSIELNAGNGYKSYSWDTGDTTSNITVKRNGIYKVTVINTSGCTASDSSYVSIVKANILNNDTIICKGSSIKLSIDSLFVGSNITSINQLPTNLQKGLVAFYPFNGNATDLSENGNNGTVNGASLSNDRFGNSNSAFSFNGLNNYITVPNSTSLNIDSAITISAWINSGNVNVSQRIVDKCVGFTTNGWLMDLSCTPQDISKIRGIVGNTSSNLSSPLILPNIWNLVTVTYDLNFEKFYINGVLTNSYALKSITPLNNVNLFIGSSTDLGPVFFNGKLDDIGIYNRALNPVEIQQLYTLKPIVSWSTGDSTNSINVTPLKTTTYYCTISNGISSCTDSVKVTVNQPITNTTNISGCNSLIYKGLTYTSSAIEKDTIRTKQGCDSVYNIATITVNKITSTTNPTSISGCNSLVYKGKIYTASAIERDTIKSVQGCDSIYNVATISINKITPITNLTNISGCNSIVYKGKTYTASAIERDTVRSFQGCDSIYNVATITINKITPVISDTAFNSCTSIVFNGITYNTTTNFTDTIRTLNGCDSVYLSVNINIVNLGITGGIKHPSKGYVIPNVSALMNGTNIINNISTDYYTFNCLPQASNETIRLYKNNDLDKANGVTTLDVALIQSHILQKNILNSPYKIIAADVNGDGSVSVLDIVYVKRLILGLDTTFTNPTTKQTRLWAFVDSSYKFPDTTNPFPIKDSISYTGLSASKTNQTFIGCKLGDVNWDWNPAIPRPMVNNVNAVVLSYSLAGFYPSDALAGRADGLAGRTDGYVHIPVRVKNFKDMLGMQFTISFNANVLQWQGISNNPLNIETGTNHAAEGSVTFLWVDAKNEIKTLEDGSVIMELVFNPTGNCTNEQLDLNSSITSIAAYDKDYNLHGIVLNPSLINITDIVKETWTVAPNPTTNGIIHVQMNLKDRKIIVLRLSDNTGRVILTKQVEGVKGTNNITLREGNIPTGTYYLQATGVEGEEVKKIMVQ